MRNGLDRKLRYKFAIPADEAIFPTCSLANSYDDKDAFLRDANQNDLSGSALQVVEVIPAAYECFDMAFKIPLADGTYILVILDTKSGVITIPNTNTSSQTNSSIPSVGTKASGGGALQPSMSELPKGGAQAQHVMDLADLARQIPAADVVPGSVLECLRTGSFVYIYVNTTEGSSSFAVNDYVMQLGEQQAVASLSFFTPLYRLVRASSDKSQFYDKRPPTAPSPPVPPSSPPRVNKPRKKATRGSP
jgi:hypothetical protein